MQWQLLFLSMAPAAVFVLVRRLGPLRDAVAAAIGMAAIELVYNSLQVGRLELFSLASLLLFAGLGAVSWRRTEERWIELQPVVLQLGVAAVFVYYGLARDVPLLVVILERYVGLPEILPAYQRGYATVYATTLSRSLPVLLVLHAAWTAEAALRRSPSWWLAVRVPGLYVGIALLFLAERLLGVKP